MSPSHAEMILLAILIVATHSLVGLLAIWAGLGRPHWFLRVAVVGGILLLLLLIPAYEPLLLFSIQAAVVILPLMLVRALRVPAPAARPDGGSRTRAAARFQVQFSLSDLLLLTVVVAVIVAVIVNAPSDLHEFWDLVWHYVQGPFDRQVISGGSQRTPAQGWAAFFLSGLALGISTLVAAWVGLGRRRLWLRLVALSLVPTAPVMAAWLALTRASGWLASGRRESAPASPGTKASRMTARRLARLAAVVLSLSILVPPVATFCLLVAPAPQAPQIALPNPNGYDDLLKAGKTLHPGDPTSPRQALDMARAALARECVVPLEYSISDLEDRERLFTLRALAGALSAEGRLAEVNGRPADAARDYLDVIRLARAGSRGGLAIDWLVGHALHGIGVEALIRLRKTLTPEHCRELIGTLQTLNAHRESVEDVLDRDQLWERIACDWKDQLMRWVSMVAGSESSLRPALEYMETRNQARLRLLICGLALRSYCGEHARPPERLADLVPVYLPEPPQDPYTGEPLLYRREGAKYVLYSVGPDGQDDGGKPWDEMNWSGDFLLDELSQAP
jgi:hypothetical protein